MVIMWMHMQVMQSLFDLQAHVIQVQLGKSFGFALPARNLFTQENETRAWSQLSVVPDESLIRYSVSVTVTCSKV